MQAAPPLQSLVFIPKADKGDYADNYRPLGLPNTCDRLIDLAAYTQFAPSLVGYLHPAQALLNTFREPQANFLTVQQFLDNTDVPGSVLLSDLAKAFERVNPHWIMHVLFALRVPYWVIVYCRHILFGRKVLHKIGARFRPPLSLRTGVDMGRAFSVLLFCIAMDPWYHHVHKIPRVCINIGYMDDNATGGVGLTWLHEAQRLIHKFHSAGFQVLTHSCYLAQPLAHCPPTIACLEDCPPVLHGFPSLWKAYAAIPPCSYVKLCCGSKSITIPSSWIRINDVLSIPAYPRLLTLLHTSPCHCKCKTFLLPNFPLSPQDLLFLDSTPFGCKIAAASATMLGLFLHYRLGPRCPFPFTASSHPPHPLPLRLWTLVLSLPRGSFSWLGAYQPCVLCGCGDNSVQHWLYFCPVPALAGSLLLRTPWKTSSWFLQESFSASRLAQIAGLWVSTRQFVHERSGLPPPSLDLPPATSDTILQLATHLATRSLSHIPLAYRPTHLHLSNPNPLPASCFF